MIKFILLLSVMIFGVSTKVLATGYPKPSLWAEDNLENNKDNYFYKKTRLECVRKGIENATGILPSSKYLAAIALKVRTDVKIGNTKEALDALGEENYDYRFLYLHTIARYVSTYGVCRFDEAGKNGVDGFEHGESKLVADFLGTNLSSIKIKNPPEESIVLDNDSVTQMIAGKNYLLIDELFNSKIDDQPKIYRLLPDGKRKELAKDGIKFAVNHLGARIPFINSENSFRNCVSDMKNYQEGNGKNSGLKNETNNKFISSQNLCSSIMSSCGYNLPDACTDNPYPESKSPTAPAQPRRETEKPASR